MKAKDRRRNPEFRKVHGTLDQQRELKWMLTVILAVILFTVLMSLQGCAQAPTDKDGNSHQRTVTIICLLSMCEQEHADGIHGQIDQTEGEDGQLDADIQVPLEAL